MALQTSRNRSLWVIAGMVAAVAAVFFAWRLFYAPGDALVETLQGHAGSAGTARLKQLIASLITNYQDTRANATQWSGVFWGFSFGALAASACAGVVLKIDSLAIDDAKRKDIAAVLSLVAALLVGISTSGEFQRKWQVNRLAAAKLERLGYDLVADADPDPGAYFRALGEIQYERTTQITGKPGEPARAGRPASASAPG